MAGKKKYCYPDTTIAYFLLRGHSLQRDRVRKIQAGRPWRISPIVRMEYIRGVIICLIEFHSLLKESGTVHDAITAWSDQFNHRKIRVVMRHFTGILKRQEQSDDRTIVARRVGEYIRELLEEFDAEFGTIVRNRLSCKIAPMRFTPGTYDESTLLDFFERFVRIYDGTPDCNQCGFKALWRHRLERQGIDLYGATQVVNFLGKQNAGYRKQAENLRKALEVPGGDPDCKWCARLGDSMVAMQCPDGDPLIAGDRSFIALTTILGKQMEYVPSVTALRKAARDQV